MIASGVEYDGINYDDRKNKIVKIKSPRFLNVEKHVYSKKYSYVIKTVSVGSFVCTISSCKKLDEYFTLSEQYYGKQWKNHICVLAERKYYCISSFMKQVFVIGGTDTNSCMKYDLNTEQWTNIANTLEIRDTSACTVFEGKIVVSGGCINNNSNRIGLRSVEIYDYHENKWSFLPEMIYGMSFHKLVSMGNKMFVVGDNNQCEVFDSFSRKFSLIKRIPSDNYIIYNNNIVADIGHEFTVYSTCIGYSVIYSYDIVAEEWHKEDKKLEVIEYVYNCIKVPVT